MKSWWVKEMRNIVCPLFTQSNSRKAGFLFVLYFNINILSETPKQGLIIENVMTSQLSYDHVG